MAGTKIVCTIGPASCSDDTISGLINAGMDVARLNFSHGDHSTHCEWIKRLRRAATSAGTHLTILQDLSGPKIRIGTFIEGRVFLTPGSRFTLTTEDVDGTASIVQVSVDNLTELATAASRLMLADGAIELRVDEVVGSEVHCTVVVGGLLTDRKGISFPGSCLPDNPLTAKDLADLEVGINEEVDYIALSFVRSGADVKQLKQLLEKRGCRAGIIAKLERPEALENLAEILEEADGVMVARGDLGVELAPEKVPLAQKQIIREACQRDKYVITATQMLESMIHSQWPTRAEASDVANAVLDGTDAVMLSAESATGDHPVRVVEMMERILLETEQGEAGIIERNRRRREQRSVAKAIAQSVSDLSDWVDCRAVCCFTQSGVTPRLVSKTRPGVPVIGLSPDLGVLRQINLGRRIVPVQTEQVVSVDGMLAEVERVMLESGLAHPGETVIIAAGYPFGESWKTNLAKIHKLGGDKE